MARLLPAAFLALALCVAGAAAQRSCLTAAGQRYWGLGYKGGNATTDEVLPRLTGILTAQNCSDNCQIDPTCVSWIWSGATDKKCFRSNKPIFGTEANSAYASGNCTSAAATPSPSPRPPSPSPAVAGVTPSPSPRPPSPSPAAAATRSCVTAVGQRYHGLTYKTGSLSDEVLPRLTGIATAQSCSDNCLADPTCRTWIWSGATDKKCFRSIKPFTGTDASSAYASGNCTSAAAATPSPSPAAGVTPSPSPMPPSPSPRLASPSPRPASPSPMLLAICGAPPPAPGNSNWAVDCTGYLTGRRCNATCLPGFSGTPFVTCGPTGAWSAVNGTCTFVPSYIGSCGVIANNTRFYGMGAPAGQAGVGTAADQVGPSISNASWSTQDPSPCREICKSEPTCKIWVYLKSSRTCFRGTKAYTNQATDAGFASGNCSSTPVCPALPPSPGAVWPANCSNAFNATCNATCAAGWQGSGPRAKCDNGIWAVTNPCTPFKCAWPPTPLPTGGNATWQNVDPFNPICDGSTALVPNMTTCNAWCVVGVGGATGTCVNSVWANAVSENCNTTGTDTLHFEDLDNSHVLGDGWVYHGIYFAGIDFVFDALSQSTYLGCVSSNSSYERSVISRPTVVTNIQRTVMLAPQDPELESFTVHALGITATFWTAINLTLQPYDVYGTPMLPVRYTAGPSVQLVRTPSLARMSKLEIIVMSDGTGTRGCPEYNAWEGYAYDFALDNVIVSTERNPAACYSMPPAAPGVASWSSLCSRGIGHNRTCAGKCSNVGTSGALATCLNGVYTVTRACTPIDAVARVSASVRGGSPRVCGISEGTLACGSWASSLTPSRWRSVGAPSDLIDISIDGVGACGITSPRSYAFCTDDYTASSPNWNLVLGGNLTQISRDSGLILAVHFEYGQFYVYFIQPGWDAQFWWWYLVQGPPYMTNVALSNLRSCAVDTASLVYCSLDVTFYLGANWLLASPIIGATEVGPSYVPFSQIDMAEIGFLACATHAQTKDVWCGTPLIDPLSWAQTPIKADTLSVINGGLAYTLDSRAYGTNSPCTAASLASLPGMQWNCGGTRIGEECTGQCADGYSNGGMPITVTCLPGDVWTPVQDYMRCRPTGASASRVYAGCYNNPAGFTTLTASAAMTGELCASLAAKAGYLYAAVKGMDCGGISTELGTAAADSACSTACPGNAAETCGGGTDDWSVYKTSASGAAPDLPFIGCMAEPNCAADPSARPLTWIGTITSMTVESCGAAAMARGFKYFAINNVQECYGGNDISAYTTAGTCDLACPGNTLQTCGGACGTSIFSTRLAASGQCPTLNNGGLEDGFSMIGWTVARQLDFPEDTWVVAYEGGLLPASAQVTLALPPGGGTTSFNWAAADMGGGNALVAYQRWGPVEAQDVLTFDYLVSNPLGLPLSAPPTTDANSMSNQFRVDLVDPTIQAWFGPVSNGLIATALAPSAVVVDGAWHSVTFDMSAYAGRVVLIAFRTTFTDVFNVQFDNVVVTRGCSSSTAAAATASATATATAATAAAKPAVANLQVAQGPACPTCQRRSEPAPTAAPVPRATSRPVVAATGAAVANKAPVKVGKIPKPTAVAANAPVVPAGAQGVDLIRKGEGGLKLPGVPTLGVASSTGGFPQPKLPPGVPADARRPTDRPAAQGKQPDVPINAVAVNMAAAVPKRR